MDMSSDLTPEHLLSNMEPSELYDNLERSNIIIFFENESLGMYAHKGILSRRCAAFSNVFREGGIAFNCKVTTLSAEERIQSPPVIRCLIKHLYDADVDHNEVEMQTWLDLYVNRKLKLWLSLEVDNKSKFRIAPGMASISTKNIRSTLELLVRGESIGPDIDFELAIIERR